MKKLNILMVNPHDIYSSSEPWTIRMTSIAKEFVKKGHNVKLVYFPLPKEKRGPLRIKKIEEYETIPFSRRKWHIIRNTIAMIKLGKWADIIYFQKCFSIASLPSLISAYVNNKPVHYDWDDWEYGIYMWDPPSRLYGKYLDIMEKTIPKLVDSISVSSEELRKMALDLGVDNDKITKVNVCADIKDFNPKKWDEKEIIQKYGLKKPIVLYLGQLHGAQYAELFIKSAKHVLQKHPEANFLVAGGGEDLPRLKQITKKIGLEDKITFTGMLNNSDVKKALAAADIAVACFDNTKQVRCKSPLKIVEYMASGKAIVASNVGEIPWMVGESKKTINNKPKKRKIREIISEKIKYVDMINLGDVNSEILHGPFGEWKKSKNKYGNTDNFSRPSKNNKKAYWRSFSEETGVFLNLGKIYFNRTDLVLKIKLFDEIKQRGSLERINVLVSHGGEDWFKIGNLKLTGKRKWVVFSMKINHNLLKTNKIRVKLHNKECLPKKVDWIKILRP